ncbi:MFS transporter [Flavobacterium sp. N1719]|uniref:MFS transporter n=1 Tax=Flavobacterium sp. N1719 TaxID=2885633 RepID=UPI002221D00C|nr:MFS transporter [Flavobacterium sp. N1719]
MQSTVSTPSFQKLRSRYRNRVRLATALFFFGMGFSFATWASRIPSIKSQLQLTEADLGTLLLALPLGQLLAMTFSGKLVTHYGSRWICTFGLLLYAGCLPFIGLSHNKWELAIALTSFGFFGNLCNIAVNTQGVYTQSFFEKPIMGSFHGSWSLAGFAGALTGLVMLSFQMSVLHHFLIALGFVTVLVITNTRYLVKTQASKPEEKQSYNFFKNPDKTLLWLGIICFCGMASEGIMFDWSGVYFKEIVKVPGALVVLGYTTFMISMAAGRFLSDLFVAQLGYRKVLLLSGFVISIGLYTAVIFPYLIPSTIAFMLVGIGVSNVIPIIFNSAGNHPTIPTGIALTVVTSISFLGFLIGPPIIGYIAELTNLRYSFAVIGVFGLIIVCLVQKLSLFKG